MTFKIEYPSKLTSNNKDIVIFVSNLSQLKNSEFLPDSDFYLKSNQFINQINNKNYFLLRNIKQNNSLLNIMVVLLKNSIISKIPLGSEIYSIFFKSEVKLEIINSPFSSVGTFIRESSLKPIILRFFEKET